jgi:hypothetical protein
MGGLATRYAASLASGGRRVGSLLGLVVTVGTPQGHCVVRGKGHDLGGHGG